MQSSLSEGAAESLQKHQRLLEHLAAQKRARELAVPTDDRLCQLRLRELSQPIKLFGESLAARRERLRRFMAENGIEQGMPQVTDEGDQQQQHQQLHQPLTGAEAEQRKKQRFFYPGAPQLKDVRVELISYSLARASERLAAARRRRQVVRATTSGAPDAFAVEYAKRADHFKRAGISASEVGSARPLSSCAFRGSLLAVSDWGGAVKVYDTRGGKFVWEKLGAHEDRAQHVHWAADDRLLSAGADSVVRMWAVAPVPEEQKVRLVPKELLTLKGHRNRVNRVVTCFGGRLAATSSFDGTWSLWDLQRDGQLLSTQEGHRGAVYGLAAHCDGAVICTTGLDGVARVWDLRSGCAVVTLKGHMKMTLSVDFSPNGIMLATGSDDNTARLWDLRQRGVLYVYPAHTNTVSSVCFDSTGEFLCSASFDKTLRVWGTRDNSCLSVLAGHDLRISHCAVHPTTSVIASVSFDRTIKLWGL